MKSGNQTNHSSDEIQAGDTFKLRLKIGVEALLTCELMFYNIYFPKLKLFQNSAVSQGHHAARWRSVVAVQTVAD